MCGGFNLVLTENIWKKPGFARIESVLSSWNAIINAKIDFRNILSVNVEMLLSLNVEMPRKRCH